jgi:Methyltransferase domain
MVNRSGAATKKYAREYDVCFKSYFSLTSSMPLFDGRLMPNWARHPVKRIAGIPGIAGRSELLARFYWQGRLAETRRACSDVPLFSTREDLYAHVNQAFFDVGSRAMDFLEFGVYQGASIQAWAALNHNPATRYWGFDSFAGLPEDWHAGKEKGTFSTSGKTPAVADPRVRFVVGLFQETLPSFLESFTPQNRLLVHNDSDLYSSTLYCLTMMNSLLGAETIMIFDDFYDSLHQYRALMDYCSAYRRSFRIVGVTKEFGQAAIEIH